MSSKPISYAQRELRLTQEIVGAIERATAGRHAIGWRNVSRAATHALLATNSVEPEKAPLLRQSLNLP